MDRIPEEVIEELRERADIVEIISREVSLKRSGASYKGRCPFHEEKTPSFHVFPDSGRYKCFGCGEGGNVIRFMMEKMGFRFIDALEELSRETGVPIPRRDRTPAEQERDKQRGAIREALVFAASYYRELLRKHPAGHQARQYLTDRGFTEETLETFGAGFARDEFDGDRSLLGYARGKGFAVDILEAAGLVRTNERGKRYDFFRGRIMFPIRDLRGRVIGFGGRILDSEGPKYINSPDTVLFGKSRELYGQDLARAVAHSAGRILVVEGYTDVMHCRQAGFPETVAGLGTALTTENARNLRRFGVPITLLYDGDAAGLAAAERGSDILMAEEVDASVAILPAGEDPADLLTREGPGALEEVLGSAKTLLDYRIQRLSARYDFSTIDGAHRAAKEMLEVIAQIKDEVRQGVALRLLAERVGVPESSLRNTMPKPRRMSPRGSRQNLSGTRAAENPGGSASFGPKSPGVRSDGHGSQIHGSDGDQPPLSDAGFAGGGFGVSESMEHGALPDAELFEASDVGDSVPAEPPEQAIETAERRFLEAALVDADAWDRIVERYPLDKFRNSAFRRVADAVHTLRQGGESISRDALAGMLADSDEAIRALHVLQTTENAGARALQDLDRILYTQELKQALRSQSLAEVVRARESGPEQVT